MEQGKVSVIVPIYNVEKFLPACIQSLIDQTYKNLEILLVDDGSPDGSGAICDEFAAKDDRIVVIHKENGGASSARNAGLDAATGDYIAFVDGDDYIQPDMYEFLMDILLKYDADISRCGMVRITGDIREEWGIYTKEPVIRNTKESICDVGEAYGILPVSPCNKIFKKSVIENVRFDTRFVYAEDTLFNYYAACNAKSIVCWDKIMYNYVGNPDSVAHKKFNIGKLDEHRVTDIIMEEQKDNYGVYQYCLKGDIMKAFRTIKEIIIDDTGWEHFKPIRKRILKHKKEILNNSLYSKITKLKTVLLWISPPMYKLYVKKTRG